MEIKPQTTKRLFSYLKKHKIKIIFGMIATTLMGLIDGSIAGIIGVFYTFATGISAPLKDGEIIHSSINFEKEVLGYNIKLIDLDFIGSSELLKGFLFISLTYVTLFLIKVVFVYLREILMNSSAQRILQQFRLDVYQAIQRLPVKYFDQNKTGDILSRVTYDVNTLGSTINVFITLSQSLIYIFIFVPILFFLNWKLTIFAVLVFPGSAMILKLFRKKLKKVGEKLSANVGDYTSFLQEKISNQKVVKTFANEEHEQTSYAKLIENNFKLNFKAIRIIALQKPSNEIFSTAGVAGLMIFLGWQLINKEINFGDILVYFAVIQMAYKPIKSLADASSQLEMALVSARKIFDLIDTPPEQNLLLPSAPVVPSSIESIEFKNVCFSYKDNEPVLKNISFSIKRGETVAFVGSSGSGKSTILNLLPRFYDIESGSILINGIDIGAIPLADLRALFSMVHQDSSFFSGSVKENILYGNLSASENDIVQFAGIANATEFIDKLPNGYDTQIGERGVQLSGGQRQRLAIARSMIRKPQVLLLDEATSALDTESEKLVQDALDKVMHKTTSLVVAHRLSTIKNADRIIVINQGQLAECGTHDELLLKNGIYKRLYDLQFKV